MTAQTSTPGRERDARSRGSRAITHRFRDPGPWIVLAVHVLVFVALACWSWRKWPDPLVDFGRELYLPWQITRGRVLYQDLASLFGPLSPYVNALWFVLFGPSLLTLVVCNLVIFAACVAGIYHLIRIATDRITATAVGVTTLLLFGFSQYSQVGNYNFVTPYSHEATHGFALSVAALLCLHRAIKAQAVWFSAAAGFCYGLVLLTKPEAGVAAGVGVGSAWLAAGALSASDKRELARSVPVFLAFTAAPALLFFAYFAGHMEPLDALRAVAGAWTTPNRSAIVANAFYLGSSGLDDPAANAAQVLRASAGFLLFVAAAIAVSWPGAAALSRATMARRWLPPLILSVFTVSLLREGGQHLPRALPLIALTTLIAAASLFRTAKGDREAAVALLPLVMWSAFALALLAKMGLAARIAHYGFFLALPATATAVVLVSWVIPRLLDAWTQRDAGPVFRLIALCALGAVVVPYIGLSNGSYRTKVLPVGSGRDRFYASTARWQGDAVRSAWEWIGRTASPDATIAVLPEGVMLNFLLRRDSPLRVVNLMPPEVLAFGEDGVLQSLVDAPPTYLVLAHADMGEYGYPPFGRERRYGRRIVEWARANYRTVEVIGEQPMSATGYGIEILERNGPILPADTAAE